MEGRISVRSMAWTLDPVRRMGDTAGRAIHFAKQYSRTRSYLPWTNDHAISGPVCTGRVLGPTNGKSCMRYAMFRPSRSTPVPTPYNSTAAAENCTCNISTSSITPKLQQNMRIARLLLLGVWVLGYGYAQGPYTACVDISFRTHRLTPA